MRLAIWIFVTSACGRTPTDREGSASAGSATARAVRTGSASGNASADAGDSGAAEVHAAQRPSVTLVKPGAQPRRAFSYAPRSEQRTAKLTFDVGPSDVPEGLAMAFAVTLTWKTPALATGTYEFLVADSRAILPKDVQAKGGKGGEAAVIAGLGGMFAAIGGHVEADSHGRATLVRTTSTFPTHPSLLWVLHPLLVPLPMEPVGVGATWRTAQHVSMDDHEGEAERVYELTAVAGDTLSIKVTGTTKWRDATGSAGTDSSSIVVETVTGAVTVKPSDVLAQTATIVSEQDLGIAKATLHIKL